jgi:hypothetical protein
MVNKTGTVRNPFSGKSVRWNLAPVAESIGIIVWSIGNADHLDNTPAGGHTPWRNGSVVGTVWAVDIMVDHKGKAYLEQFEDFVIRYCKSDADTTWIKFFNLNGSQYDFAGRRLRGSADHHLHLEVRDGKQNAAGGLMAAWKRHKNPPVRPTTAPLMPAIYNRLGFIAEARLKQMTGDPKVWLTGRGKKAHVKSPAELREIQAYMRARSLPANVEQVPNPIPGTEV